EKKCAYCNAPYWSPDKRSKYCDDACKQAAHRLRKKIVVTDGDRALRNDDAALRNNDRDVTDSYRAPAPVREREEGARNSHETNHDPPPQARARGFVKPTIDEVRAYCVERANNIDPEHFINHYESNGWLVGKAPMKNWKATVCKWERNGI